MMIKAFKWHTLTVILYILLPLKLYPQSGLLAYVPAGVCKNYINITGNTNVRQFEFWLEFPVLKIFPADNFVLSSQQQADLYEISLPVKNFKADNRLILSDFMTLLKANLYPEITIGISYKQLLDFLEAENNTLQHIHITLAGVTKEYPISCIVNSCKDKKVYISGYKTIKLTDFNIEPPKKFQGLVRVENEVLINFGFVFMFMNQIQNL